MPNSFWRNEVRHVHDGEPASESVLSRPAVDLEDRTSYLKGRVDDAELGEAVVRRDVPCVAGALPGQPVYWHASNGQFELALAAATTHPTGGYLVPAASALCLGVVARRSSATTADVALLGRLDTDLADAGIASPVSGIYYLSSTAPGQLTAVRPAVGIPVLYHDGAGTAYVDPQIQGFYDDHLHVRFDLVCRPAGSADSYSPGTGRHTVADADPELKGWLPKDDGALGGVYPEGAAFGYNLVADRELGELWHKLVPSQAVLFWDKGLDPDTGGTLVPQGPDGLCVINEYGIWWMSDAQGDVPWPVGWDAGASSSWDAEPNGSAPEVPRAREMRLVLLTTQMLALTDQTAVTSLRPARNAPLVLQSRYGDTTATTGDLEIDLDLALAVADTAAAGTHLAVKEASGQTLKRGPVTSYLREGPGIKLSSAQKSGGRFYGDVRVALASADGAGQEVTPQVVQLADAQERTIAGWPMLGLPAGRASSLVIRYRVNATGLARLRLHLYGPVSGTFPALVATYRYLDLPDPGAQATLPTSDTALTLVTNLAITTGQLLTVVSDPITVSNGLLLVTLSRPGADGYPSELGLAGYDLVVSTE
jgi:hypothetical protein